MVTTLLNITGIELPTSPPSDEKVRVPTHPDHPFLKIFSGSTGRSQGPFQPSPPEPRCPNLLYNQWFPLKAPATDKESCQPRHIRTPNKGRLNFLIELLSPR